MFRYINWIGQGFGIYRLLTQISRFFFLLQITWSKGAGQDLYMPYINRPDAVILEEN
jgi:hypothetical protein